MGKTEVAAEFVHRHREEYDAIFWLQADRSADLLHNFSDMAVQLGLNTTERTELAVCNDLFKAWLAQPIKHRGLPGTVDSNLAKWLIVFDNLEDPEFLDDCWPQFGHGAVLITSRDPTLGQSPYIGSAGFVAIDLPPFTATEGVELLMRLTNSASGTPEQAITAVRRVCGFPIAIVQMAALASRLCIDFEETLEVYYKVNFDGRAFERESQVLSDSNNLASVFALEELSRESTALLEVLSLLDGDSGFESLLTRNDTSVDLDHFPIDRANYLQARSELIRRSLVVHLKPQTFCIHRVLQDIVKAQMSADRWQKVLGAAVTLVSAKWPFTTQAKRYTVARWQGCEQMMPHVWSIHEAYVGFVDRYVSFEGPMAFASLLADAAGYVISTLQNKVCADMVQIPAGARQLCHDSRVFDNRRVHMRNVVAGPFRGDE
jgi:hypothetical protein